jgi:hypothetical protein
MPWIFSIVGKTETSGVPLPTRDGAWVLAQESLTVALSNAASQDLTSSVIDFIPPGSDFIVIANTAALNTSSDADIAVLIAGTRAGTYTLLKDDLIGSIDTKVATALYDTSTNGEAPYYKLFVDSDGTQKKADVIVLQVLYRNV